VGLRGGCVLIVSEVVMFSGRARDLSVSFRYNREILASPSCLIPIKIALGVICIPNHNCLRSHFSIHVEKMSKFNG
jgi:hypothetical protein